MGDMGDIGNLRNGGKSLTNSVTSPDRAGLPFITERSQAGEVRKQFIKDAKWQHWSAEWLAWLVLAEFTRTESAHNIKLEEPWPKEDKNKINAELETLANYAEDERADALDEIVSQHGLYVNFLGESAHIMGISEASHPKTIALLHVAGLIGLSVAMSLKRNPHADQEPRPRPTQYLPALKPPVPVPGHPSYPSGHALQSALMALCVKAIEPLPKEMHPTLDALAHRIARNREIAGLHFPTDSDAGRSGAKKAFDILKSLPEEGEFQKLRKLACKEWK
jgi:hypothetical protein